MRGAAATKGAYDARMHWLDDLMGWTAVRPAFYRDGWGDLDRAVAQALSLTRESDILPIEITWEDEGREDAGTWVRRGSFISPRASALPEESRVAMFELVLPLDRTKEKPPIVSGPGATCRWAAIQSGTSSAR